MPARCPPAAPSQSGDQKPDRTASAIRSIYALDFATDRRIYMAIRVSHR